MKTLSRKSVIKAVHELGVHDGGPRKAPHRVWRLVDPWGDVSFKLADVFVIIWCREGRRRAGSMRVVGLPQTGISRTVQVAREIQRVIPLPALFEAHGTSIKGSLVAGKIGKWQ